MAGLAGPVDLARRDAGQPDARPFRAPDRAVAVPDVRRRAGELLPGRNDGDSGSGEQEQRHIAEMPPVAQTGKRIRRFAGVQMKLLLGIAALSLATMLPASEQACAAGGCCKMCRSSKACGDSCISKNKTCTKGKGCACNA